MTSTIEVPTAAPSTDNLLMAAGYLTHQQTARGIGVSVRTLDRMYSRQQGPARTRIGKKILYRRASVLEWLESQEEAPRRKSRTKREAA